MSLPIGTITEQKYLWLRCPHCGDSQNHLDRGHLSVNLHAGIFHCFRCKESGRVSESQALAYNIEYGVDIHVYESQTTSLFEHYEQRLVPGPGNTRYSALPRWHTVHKEITYDAFKIRDPYDGVTCGLYFRGPTKKKHIVGKVAIAFGGDQLLSSHDHPIRLVEGPYDCLTPQDVAVFGTISIGNLKLLAGHVMILTPDGDVWSDRDLRKQFLKTVEYAMSPWCPCAVQGLEYLAEDKDPKEVPIAERRYIPRKDFGKVLKFYRKESTRWHLPSSS